MNKLMLSALLFFSYTFITHVYYNREITKEEYKCLSDMGIELKKPIRQYQLLKIVNRTIDGEIVR